MADGGIIKWEREDPGTHSVGVGRVMGKLRFKLIPAGSPPFYELHEKIATRGDFDWWIPVALSARCPYQMAHAETLVPDLEALAAVGAEL